MLAVVRGSAVNQDGASNGLTAPNGPSQQRVIRAALADADLDVGDVDVVEGHGTGTVLGDPIEAQALLATYGAGRDGEPLWLGSLKSNVGHTQAAAGVGGVMKMIQAMRHGVMPQTLHVEAPSSKVDWSSGSVSLLTEARPWPETSRPRRAAVSSFGISGTNAHVIVEQAPADREPGEPGEPVRGPVAWVVSGASGSALRAQAQRLAEHLGRRPGLDVRDVGSTLASRPVFEHRAVVVGADRDELLAGITALTEDTPAPGVVSGQAADGKTVFVFPGQGAQWLGMGRGLYAAFPQFAEAFDEVLAVLERHGFEALREVLWGEDDEVLRRTEFAQPLLFAVGVALARTLDGWGLAPDLVIGHSVGEFAAAHVAGVLTLEDAARLVAARARLMQALPEGGAMVAIRASEAEVGPLLAKGVDVAAVNGPKAVVISGAGPEVSEVVERAEATGFKTEQLRVSHAFHSALMEPMLEEFERAAGEVAVGSALIPVLSNVTGGVAGDDFGSAAYWVRHVREAVRFADGIKAAAADGGRRFVVLGPDGGLTNLITQCVESGGIEAGPVVAALRRNRPEVTAVLTGLAEVFAAGVPVDWRGVFTAMGGRWADLPTYAFQHERYWLETPLPSGDVGGAGLEVVEHPLLGAAVRVPGTGQVVLTGRLSLRGQPWLADHAIFGRVTVPGTVFVELLACAGGQVGCPGVRELTFEAPLVLPEGTGVDVSVLIASAEEAEPGARAVSIHSRPVDADGAEWTLHARALLTVDEEPVGDDEPAQWPPAGAEPVDVARGYAELAERGYGYGPAFRAARALWRRGDEVFAEVAAPQGGLDTTGFGVHPALLDAVVHAARLVPDGGGPLGGGEGVALPFAWEGVRLGVAGESVLRARIAPAGRPGAVSVSVVDAVGRPVVSVRSFVTRPVSARELGAVSGRGLYEVVWSSVPAEGDGREAEWRDWPDAVGDGVSEAGVVVAEIGPFSGQTTQGVRAATGRVLEMVQAWLAARRPGVLVLVTRGAVALPGEDVADLAGAAAWGLVRSAQSEHPGRFALVDIDEASDTRSLRNLVGSAVAAGEPQITVRSGAVRVARLAKAADPGVGEDVSGGTVVVTGGIGGLGALVARRLVEGYGVGRVVLVSRRGLAAPGAEELRRELTGAGAQADVVACDMSNREAVMELIAGIGDRFPLMGVVHAAGVLDDGVVESLSPERLEPVLAAKADAAWFLHEATRDLDLKMFVMFSSIAGTAGAPGQANYAAANAFLDGLAAHRRAAGLAGVAVAWGPWSESGGMADRLGTADAARVEREGLRPLLPEDGLALFDAATGHPAAQVVAARWDTGALRTRAGAGLLPPLLSGLVPAVPRSAGGSGAELRRRMTDLDDAERRRVMLEVVQGQVALVLGHTSGDQVDPDTSFEKLGLDSLTALQVRNQLTAVSGLRLPATLVFDYPTPAKTAEFMDGLLAPEPATERSDAAPAAVNAAEPVAVVGIGCRFPGGVVSPSGLWDLVASGGAGVSEFPEDRGWDVEELFDPDPDAVGKSYVRAGGFLEDVAGFDAAFFGISPREAVAMDPQQRLLLEVVWEALEDAGIDPAALRGSRTGVFAGVFGQDYGLTARANGGPGDVEGHMTGVLGSVVSGRVAYVLGLEGPAVSVDTACSSSLVALHLAVQSLRAGECDLAVVGGVTVMSSPSPFVEFSRQRGLAPDGRCKSFADSADGTVWGEGVGVVVLERLPDARERRRRVVGLVRGSAVNQDGASNGLTAPNGPSQQRVIQAALTSAGLGAGDVDVVEGHGTGTVLGDPIEVQALQATYGAGRAGEPLWLGSLKSNIGHTQAAAGVGGVIKMIQAMRHGIMPPTLHVDAPSGKVDWTPGSVRILTEARSWPEVPRPRRAAVSSFGISGTNAHVILEQAPPDREPTEGYEPSGPVAWVVSGASVSVLRAQAERLAEHVDQRPDLDIRDVGYTLASRPLFEHRAVVIGGDRDELLAGITALAEDRPAPGVVSGQAANGKTVFVFPGQGAQWLGMGRELYGAFPQFALAFDEVLAVLERYGSEELRAVLWGGDERALRRTEFAQPLLFATGVALARTLQEWGLAPDLVIGHSVGEFAAAHVAGMLKLEDAARLVAARARLMQAFPEGGAMVAVRAGEAEVSPLLVEGADIAAVNSPMSVVVSGIESAVLQTTVHAEAAGFKTERLAVSHAFHSALMEPMLEEFAAEAAQLSVTEPRIPVLANTAGDDFGSPAYWVRHVREAVRFADGIQAAADNGGRRFIVLGPDGGLTNLITQNLDAQAERFVTAPALRKKTSEAMSLMAVLATMHTAGANVRWQALLTGARQVDLPTYAFQHRRYWLASSPGTGDVSGVGQRAAEHPLFGAVVALPDSGGVVLTGRLSVKDQPWLVDHTIFGRVLVPSTAFADLVLCAGDRVGCELLDELVLHAPLPLPRRGGVQIRTSVGAPDEHSRRPVKIHSCAEDAPLDADWTLHATGTLAPSDPIDDDPLPGWEVWPPQDTVVVDPDELYTRMEAAGLAYGPGFRALRAVWRRGDDLFAEVELDGEQVRAAGRFGLHPALFDAALHPLWLLREGAELPFAYSGVRLHASEASALRVRLGVGGGAASLEAVDGAGRPVLTIDSVSTRPVSEQQIREGEDDSAADLLLSVEWVARPENGALPEMPARVAILGADPDGRLGDLPVAELRNCPDWDALTAELDTGWTPDLVITLPDTDLSDEGMVASVYAATGRMLALLQRWLAEERLDGARLVMTTRGATGNDGRLAAASSWGLARSAQSEHPGRFVLIDLDETARADVLARAIAVATARDEPQLAIRDGEIRVPRLVRAEGDRKPAAASIDGTVLITGGIGALGRSVARHLVREHGAGDLVLLARRSTAAEDAADLVAEMDGAAKVTVLSCDVADRDDLARLLAELDAEGRRPTVVVHAAGALDDGIIQSLDPQRLGTVLRPKVDGAWNLHEATRGMDLSAFVLFSSAASAFGGPGQGNYAAANAFLDALARHRQATGLPATSIAWGMWEEDTGMAGRLSAGDRARMRRSGLLPLSPAAGLRAFDVARTGERPFVVAVPIDTASLRARAEVPALFRTLIRPARPIAGGREPDGRGGLRERLAGLPPTEQSRLLQDLARTEIALVLGHAGPDDIGTDQAFSDLGFDSLAAVELRNRLNSRTGQRLPATLAFDYPSLGALTGYLLTRLTDGAATTPSSATDERERSVREALNALPYDRLRQLGIVDLLTGYTEGTAAGTDVPDDAGIAEMDVDELIGIVDRE
ncbi:SDR family NAD(P)-dependent oxidoreductase [Actinomadura bangladeshensis]|uniref:SDR family NAD(P)-dependent oxidoreductase n=1 Tax=Actinomadura bangladeshensis TaxID=453573 RepID=A0A6L9QPE7_9ACTN|nr:SDR family NAD(P)-dependent oxidoreductase [Actinomadura bangladeshensis]